MISPRTQIDLFDFLDDSHRQLQRHLVLLRAVVEACQAGHLDAAGRKQAHQVLDFFNGEARQHHLDEENHIFPVLAASSDEALAAAARRLRQDHGWLEENWLHIEPAVAAIGAGNQWFDSAELQHALEVLEALYLDHLLLEESLAYPEAQKRLQAYDRAGMGREMAQRRSARNSAASA
ncbi:MAG: hemerythrin domain-containing protein [Serpentinimonas sp.]|nr:hemerythrin domain-containing protein [Serpentinimonas sp.]